MSELVEKDGGLWLPDDSAGAVVHEQHDPSTDFLAVVFHRRDGRFKASLFEKSSYDPQWTLPFWSARYPDALFLDLPSAIQHLQTLLSNASPSAANPPPRSFRELVDRYQRGERNFHNADLDADPHCTLDGVCLDGINLSGAFVIASFRKASLRGSQFLGANVKTCDFTEADLQDADFREAALCSAIFTGAKLDGAKFEGAHIHSHVFGKGEKPE